jgi:hemolysin activation/secretion protein
MKIQSLLLKGMLLICSILPNLINPLLAAENEQPAATQTEAEQPGQEQQLKFDIWEFQVGGNTVLENTLVERSVYRYLGKDKTIEDIDAASVALQTLYKDNGYPTVLVNIPQQDVSKGIVKLDVIEGKVDRLRISGSRYFSLGMIREKVPALAEGEVPHLPTVQEQLQTLNTTNADLHATPIFRPGRSPGTVAVELRIKDDAPLHGSLEVNGRNSIGTTRTRLVANLSYANLWLKNHSFSLTYQTSPEDTKEVRVLVGSYVMPISDTGDRLAMYAVKSDSETGVSSGGALSVVGKGKIAGARWVKPLKGEERYYHSIVFGLDYKDFDEVVGLVDADSIVTPINYTMFSMDYNGTVLSLSSTTTFTASVKFAPRAFGNNTFEFENKRFEANPNFSILNALISNEYRLNNGIKLHSTVAGQFANQALVSNEQFSVGGAGTVRGYYESQVLADDAAWASFEVQSPDLKSLKKRGFKDAHLKAFIEGAATRIHEPLVGTDDREQISGAGIGLRLATKKSFQLALDVASALKANSVVEKGDIRVHFLLRGAF